MKTHPHPARIRVRAGDHLLVDTRGAVVAYGGGTSAFYLVQEAELDAELRSVEGTDDLQLEVQGRRLDVRVRRHDDGFVQLDPVDLYEVGARWAPGALSWTEEGLPTNGHARDPFHRVDVRALDGSIRVLFDGEPLVETSDARLVLEAPLPARIYVAASAFPAGAVRPAADATTTWCPYKGLATYFDLHVGDQVLPRVLWAYDRHELNHLLPELQGYLGFSGGKRLGYSFS